MLSWDDYNEDLNSAVAEQAIQNLAKEHLVQENQAQEQERMRAAAAAQQAAQEQARILAEQRAAQKAAEEAEERALAQQKAQQLAQKQAAAAPVQAAPETSLDAPILVSEASPSTAVPAQRSGRVTVDQKAMINCRADLNQLVPFKYDWAWQKYLDGCANHWMPQEVNMTADIGCGNQKAACRTMSALS